MISRGERARIIAMNKSKVGYRTRGFGELGLAVITRSHLNWLFVLITTSQFAERPVLQSEKLKQTNIQRWPVAEKLLVLIFASLQQEEQGGVNEGVECVATYFSLPGPLPIKNQTPVLRLFTLRH